MAKLKGLSHYDSDRLLNLVRHAVNHFNLCEKVRQEIIDAADMDSRKEELPDLLEDFRRYKQEHKLDMGELESCLVLCMDTLTNKDGFDYQVYRVYGPEGTDYITCSYK